MEALRALAGALFTVLVCLVAGARILSGESRDPGERFVVGAAAVSTAVFLLCATGLAYPWVMIGCGLLVCTQVRSVDGPPLSRPSWKVLPFAVYFVLYLCHALAPEVSADGAGYHLGLVVRYLHEHGFVRVPDNMYAAMPGGIELLYLFAFPIGRHSAAALIHLAFLMALAWQMHRWRPVAGYAAALLVFASPLIGIDGTSAYNDVALAAIAFTLYRLIERWREGGGTRLAAAMGFAAGFAFATKYTAALALVYAVGAVAWRSRREGAMTAGFASLVALPWLLKNWILLQNPVAPFFNRWFPNPYVMVSFEDTYRRMQASFPPGSHGILPMEAVFGVGYAGNIGTRFLIPALPFLVCALVLAIDRMPRLAIGIALVHAVLSWPALVPRYARPTTWRLEGFPWREALRVRDTGRYLETRLFGYSLDRLIEERTRPGSTVFTFTPIPEAYTSRHIRVEYQAAENKIAGALLWTAAEPSYSPTWRLRFAFPRQNLTAVRLVQAGSGNALWTIHELRLHDGDRELPREPGWRLSAQPYPWGLQDAFDNSLATFWMCGEFLRPGQWVQVEFGGERLADRVVMESSPNQPGLRLRLEGRDGAGKWHTLSEAPAISDAPRPLGLRRAVTEELKRRGIGYVLLFDGQVGADDFRLNADLWNAVMVGEDKEARLYELK